MRYILSQACPFKKFALLLLDRSNGTGRVAYRYPRVIFIDISSAQEFLKLTSITAVQQFQLPYANFTDRLTYI